MQEPRGTDNFSSINKLNMLAGLVWDMYTYSFWPNLKEWNILIDADWVKFSSRSLNKVTSCRTLFKTMVKSISDFYFSLLPWLVLDTRLHPFSFSRPRWESYYSCDSSCSTSHWLMLHLGSPRHFKCSIFNLEQLLHVHFNLCLFPLTQAHTLSCKHKQLPTKSNERGQ